LEEDERGYDGGDEFVAGIFPVLGVEVAGLEEVAGFEPSLDLGLVVVGHGLADGFKVEGGVDVEEGAFFEVVAEVVPGDVAGVFVEFLGGGSGVCAEDTVLHGFGGVGAGRRSVGIVDHEYVGGED
jgi:hypothetical protein